MTHSYTAVLHTTHTHTYICTRFLIDTMHTKGVTQYTRLQGVGISSEIVSKLSCGEMSLKLGRMESVCIAGGVGGWGDEVRGVSGIF